VVLPVAVVFVVGDVPGGDRGRAPVPPVATADLLPGVQVGQLVEPLPGGGRLDLLGEPLDDGAALGGQPVVGGDGVEVAAHDALAAGEVQSLEVGIALRPDLALYGVPAVVGRGDPAWRHPLALRAAPDGVQGRGDQIVLAALRAPLGGLPRAARY